ncbi:inositol-pentakisphosphate 2-kinase isoform X2 [Drosophila mauritiana]|uniref:inositol-pentakisphosphate 2-kinase n=1 Tax=Drosophila mauritiana TaxID=7226 RepID=A0A6P8JN25_DROMA|nr:inositol-pentakisphosphate 2-kinase isoform X2 [Drosophila mauritiana]
MTAERGPRSPGTGQKLRLRATEPLPQWTAKNLHALLDMPAAMELRQIELIYRAEGNANLVLALPQFKKVLRLPKMISSRLRQAAHQRHELADEVARPEGQRVSFERAGTEKAGDLTMPDFMAYIGIMRRLLGNEFVCGADIVAIPKEDDRFWINEHIRDQRPVSRLDKEFVGPFGLLLPDVTQLPATFDVLLANLQAKGTTGDETGAAEGGGVGGDDAGGAGTRTKNRSAVRRLGDTYAIEIKPKQGWLQLASDVNDLFDLMPSGAGTKPKEATCNQEEKEPFARDKCWCRFCSMQLLKMHNGKIKRLGHYCPLDLFSGTPSRMLDALDALLACPQNNLRVFQNSNLIYGDHANSISFDELSSRVFPGEIMVLIKHLLVACLLREYEHPESNRAEGSNQSQKQQQEQPEPEQLNQSRVSIAATETKAGAAGIGAANVVLPLGGRAHAPVVTAGQSSTRTRAAAATATTQRYTKVARVETTITRQAATSVAAGPASSNQLSGNVLATATATASAMATAGRTETKTEPETPAEAASTTSRNVNQNESQKLNRNEPANQTQAQNNKADIFRLPKNCVLQKILNLQLLVKRHFDFMWQSGYSDHSRPTYNSLRGLLAAIEGAGDAEFEPDEEQAYMLGATALDCSIMLTFQEIECETDCPADQSDAALQPWCVSLLGHHFLTKLCVLDLDPKPDSHFHKFIAQTREIEKCRRALN